MARTVKFCIFLFILNLWVIWFSPFVLVNQEKSKLYDVLVEFKEIFHKDLNIVSLINNYMPAILNRLKLPRLSGSISEGTFSAGLFYQHDIPNIDIDVEMVAMTMADNYKLCVKNTKHGFLQMRFDGECFCKQCIEDPEFSSYKTLLNNGYVMPFECKKLFFLSDCSNLTERTWFILSSFMNVMGVENFDRIKLMRIKLMRTTENITKTTYQREYELEYPRMKITLDISMLFHLQWDSNNVLRDWIQRKRMWPDLRDIAEELNMSAIIAKPSTREKLNKRTTEMRYSFAHLERKLISLHSSQQRFVFFMTKCIFYRWLKPIQPKIITSFLLKNIFFWMCEKYDPNHPIWDEHATEQAIRLVYSNLLECLEKRNMRYYFIPEINVLDNFHPDLFSDVIKTVKHIIKDVKRHFPNNTETVKKHLEIGRRVTIAGLKFWTMFKNVIEYSSLDSFNIFVSRELEILRSLQKAFRRFQKR